MLSGYVFLMTYLAICFMLAPYILYKCSKIDRIDWGEAGLLVLIWPVSIPYMAFHGMAKFRVEHKQKLENEEKEREMEQFERQMAREDQVDQYLETEKDRLKEEFEKLEQDVIRRTSSSTPKTSSKKDRPSAFLRDDDSEYLKKLRKTLRNPRVSVSPDEFDEMYEEQQEQAKVVIGHVNATYDKEN